MRLPFSRPAAQSVKDLSIALAFKAFAKEHLASMFISFLCAKHSTHTAQKNTSKFYLKTLGFVSTKKA